jgi:hypothetical protein
MLVDYAGNLELPCACQRDQYEEVHFMQHGTPPHFSAFLFVRGLTIFSVVWASRKQNSLREFQISRHVVDVMRLNHAHHNQEHLINWNKKFEILSLLSSGDGIFKKLLESAFFRLQQNVGKIMGPPFKSAQNCSVWALKLGNVFYQLCLYV